MLSLDERLSRWAGESDDSQFFFELRKRLDTLDRLRFSGFEPTLHAQTFFARLDDCLAAIEDDTDAKTFLKLLSHVLYVSREEFESLYHAIYTSTIPRWFVDVAGLDLTSADFEDDVLRLEENTWFCPITDSMPIAHFCHVNGLSHVPERPDFISLATLGDPAKVHDLIAERNVGRIVLLEDFVGSGSQIEPAVAFALTLGCEVLVAPAIACPESKIRMEKLADASAVTFTYDPLVVLDPPHFLKREAQPDEPPLFAEARDLLAKLDPIVSNGSDDHEARPFGYRGTGGLVVLYSNCPNNTVAALRFRSERWSPVFPRARRE